MNEIKKLAEEAKKALAKIENGKTYTSKYVCERLESAKESNPGDILIGTMRDVITKMASKKPFLSQREISKAYNSLYGLSGSSSMFREELGDLIGSSPLTPDPGVSKTASRIPCENELPLLYGDSELSKELSGVFSLDKNASFSALSENTLSKAAKFVRLQLGSMGVYPSDISVVKSNDHFILCNASVDTSDFTQVNVPVPVQVTSGIPSLPDSFVMDGSLTKLNKENLYVFIKDKNNFKKKTAKDRFAAQRRVDQVEVKTPSVPSALDQYADLENSLVAAATSFGSQSVSTATAAVSAELSSLGLEGTQLKISESDDKSLTYSAKIYGGETSFDAKIVVDMPNGSPIIPTKFSSNGEVYRLNRSGLRQAMSKIASGVTNPLSRVRVEVSRMNYPELVSEIEAGAAAGDYKRAEDALLTVEARFDSSKHLAALDRYSKLLKHASGSNDRERMIKEAHDRGDLITVPTSVQLFCPKLGLPVSKVAFDEKGRPVPMTRTVGSSDLSDTGAAISTSKISIS